MKIGDNDLEIRDNELKIRDNDLKNRDNELKIRQNVYAPNQILMEKFIFEFHKFAIINHLRS